MDDRLAVARAAALLKRAETKEASFLSPTTTITATNCDTNTTTESIATAICDEVDPVAMEAAKGGLSYAEFIAGRHDFRKWGATTYQGFVDCGDRAFFMDGLSEYKKRSKRGGPKHFLIVALDDLPLNAATAAELTYIELGVWNMLKQLTYRNVECSSKVAGDKIGRSATWVTRWTQLTV